MEHIEAMADDVLTHRECAELGLALLGLFKDAMVKHCNDPRMVWETLTEMVAGANRVLEPTGFAIEWRLP
jgi:hypothetical protein